MLMDIFDGIITIKDKGLKIMSPVILLTLLNSNSLGTWLGSVHHYTQANWGKPGRNAFLKTLLFCFENFILNVWPMLVA